MARRKRCSLNTSWDGPEPPNVGEVKDVTTSKMKEREGWMSRRVGDLWERTVGKHQRRVHMW